MRRGEALARLGDSGDKRRKKWEPSVVRGTEGRKRESPLGGGGPPTVRGEASLCGQEPVPGPGRKCPWREGATPVRGGSAHCEEWETLRPGGSFWGRRGDPRPGMGHHSETGGLWGERWKGTPVWDEKCLPWCDEVRGPTGPRALSGGRAGHRREGRARGGRGQQLLGSREDAEGDEEPAWHSSVSGSLRARSSRGPFGRRWAAVAPFRGVWGPGERGDGWWAGVCAWGTWAAPSGPGNG